MEKELTSEKIKGKIVEGLSETCGSVKAAEFLNSLKPNGPIDNPQVQFGKLAFLYEAMNRADFFAATSINRICEVEGLISTDANPNLCSTYAPYLLKLIELRISVITSRIIYSEQIVGIPKGWIRHVEGIVKDLEVSGLLSDSLRHLLYILRGVAKNNEEIDSYLLPNLLVPKDHHIMMQQQRQGFYPFPPQPHPLPQSTKITIDARSLGKQLRLHHEQHHSNDQQLDPMFAQLLPKMMMI